MDQGSCYGTGWVNNVTLVMASMQSVLHHFIPGVYIHSLCFGETGVEDNKSGFFGNANDLVAAACHAISSDPGLQDGYHAIGFSQGGQFLRAVAQRCPHPPVLNLITIGSQHQGISAMARCSDAHGRICWAARTIINFGAYLSCVQYRSIQAQYWHDPLHEDNYRRKSIFLADINNEREPRNASYVKNLLKLRNLVMVQFAGDTMVTPTHSSTFGFFAPGQMSRILTMTETELYQKDYIGLKRLHESGRVDIHALPGNHMEFDNLWFVNEIIDRYLLD